MNDLQSILVEILEILKNLELAICGGKDHEEGDEA